MVTQEIRVLVFSSLFPNAEQPRHGIFVETRTRKLMESGEASVRVIAPVPWFPFRSRVFGRFGRNARVPRIECRDGLVVEHPRYLSIPGLSFLTPLSMALGAVWSVLRIRGEGLGFAVIDAHYFYPDGVAAALLGRWLKKPVIITARGSDVTFWPSRKLPHVWMAWASRRAAYTVAVSQALLTEMKRLGYASEQSAVLRNGVDLALFYQEPRAMVRENLKLNGKVIVSVGNLIELKGHHLVIDAVSGLPDVTLVIIGNGPMAAELRKQARDLGVFQRIRFVDVMPQAELRMYYSAADVLILASSREGWPNVLLEAMACGTRVIATRVWGIPEIVSEPQAGLLVEERSPSAVREAIREHFSILHDPIVTRRYAESFSWGETTRRQLEILKKIGGVLS